MPKKTQIPKIRSASQVASQRKTLDELIAEQGVGKTATFDCLLGAGVDLWRDDADFERFLNALKAIRQAKG